MEVLEVLLWIVGVFVLIGAILAVLAFLGLRKLWRFIDQSFSDDGRPGPGQPPWSRRTDRPAASASAGGNRDRGDSPPTPNV